MHHEDLMGQIDTAYWQLATAEEDLAKADGLLRNCVRMENLCFGRLLITD